MADKSINGTTAIKQKEIFQIDATIKQETFKLRVASYSRVSADMEEHLTSFHTQKSYYTEMILKRIRHCKKGGNSEVVLTILASLAQEELNSLSMNVKMGK